MERERQLHRALTESLRYANSITEALENGYMGSGAKSANLLEVARKCARSIDRALRVADSERA